MREKKKKGKMEAAETKTVKKKEEAKQDIYPNVKFIK